MARSASSYLGEHYLEPRGAWRGSPLSDAVTTLLSYRTQSWSISMPFCGLYW